VGGDFYLSIIRNVRLISLENQDYCVFSTANLRLTLVPAVNTQLTSLLVVKEKRSMEKLAINPMIAGKYKANKYSAFY